MTVSRWERISALGGIVAALLLLSTFLTPQPPENDPSATGSQIVTFYAHGGWALVSVYGQIAVIVLALPFLVALSSVLRRVERSSSLPAAVALGAGVAGVCFVLINVCVQAALAGGVVKHGNPALAWVVFRVGNALEQPSDLFNGAFLMINSRLLIRTSIIPRWIGWLGLVGGAAYALGTLGVVDPGNVFGLFLLIGFLSFVVWILLTSIFMVRGKRAAEQQAPPVLSKEVAVG